MPFQSNSPDLALPQGSLILITGATGFIATHIVAEALGAGYRVRGTARSEQKAKADEAFHKNPNYQCAVIPELALRGSLDEAVKDCDGVIHAASSSDMNPDPEVVIPAAIKGVEYILESCLKEPRIKRLVYTCSSTAACLPIPGRKLHLDKNTWNDEAVRLAWEKPYSKEKGYTVYSASKTEVERTLWKFVEEKKPGFIVNSILPGVNFGRVLNNNPAVTGKLIWGIYRKGVVPGFVPSQYMVNVEDTAKIHIATLVDEKVRGERIYALDSVFTWNEVIDIIAKIKMEDKERLLSYKRDSEVRDIATVDNSLAAGLLKKWYLQQGENGRGFRGLEVSVRENLEGAGEYSGA